MPPKEDNSAAPAAAAVVEDTGEAPTTNATAAASDGRRRDREEPAEEQRVVRPRQEVLEESKWKWDSLVRTVLLHQFNMEVGKTKLKDFVKEHVGIDYPIEEKESYTMDVVVTNLNRFFPEKELREDIEGLRPFRQLRDAHQAMKDADILEQRGIVSLGQWKNTVNRDALNISAFTKGILDNAISEAEQKDNLLRQQEEIRQLKEKLEKMKRSPQVNVTVLDGLYDSVCNASWNYVVKSRESSEEKFWLEVKKGNFPPPQEWTDEEVDFFPPVAGREVPWDEFQAKERMRKTAKKNERSEYKNNSQPTQERLVMKVLTSPKGWPCGLYKKPPIFDCFVTKEVERAWRVVRDDISDCFVVDSGVFENPWQRVLIGTPGIGKSMDFGSYLLHQLLQYDTEILPVVAYFIGNETYIFNKREKQVTLYDDVIGLRTVKRLAQNLNGYTIYDCSKKMGEPPLGLPDSWGTVLISSPNEDNFKDWEKQKTACRFIINCPEERDIKAMCVWMKRDNPEDLQNYWDTIQKRMLHVGPILRFMFCKDMIYEGRWEAVLKAVGDIDSDTVVKYYGVNKDGLWRSKEVAHKIVKITRLVRRSGIEIFCNKPICPELEGEIRKGVSEALKTDAALMAILLPLHELIPRVLEEVGVKAFKERNFVERIRNKLTEFRPKDSKRPGKPWVLYDNIAACPDDLIAIPQKSAVITKMQLQFKKLYDPSSKTFPVVDGFFFVENPRKTIVGIQVTTREDHDTTTSKVKALREYLAALFVDGDKISKDFTWEIIYVQHTDNKTMTRWQECKEVLQQGQGPEDDMTRGEADAIEKHWNEEVRQYHLKISSEDVRDNN